MDENVIINIIFNIVFLKKIKTFILQITSAVVQVRYRLTIGDHLVNLHEIFIEEIN